jgi:hypothetical protein
LHHQQADELLAQYRRRGFLSSVALTTISSHGRSAPGCRKVKIHRVPAASGKTGCGAEHGYLSQQKWLAAVGQIERCVLCGAWGTQVAHRNEGKGMGLKTDDCLRYLLFAVMTALITVIS